MCHKTSRNLMGFVLVLLAVCFAGCGADNLGEFVSNTGNAMTTSLLDQLLTGFVNQVADSIEGDEGDDQADDGDNADGDDADAGDVDDGDTDDGDAGDADDGDADDGDTADDGDGAGDVAAGEAAYQACVNCHGANGEGVAGPALAGADNTEALTDRFEGGASHLGTTLTDQEITDVAAWLLTQ